MANFKVGNENSHLTYQCATVELRWLIGARGMGSDTVGGEISTPTGSGRRSNDQPSESKMGSSCARTSTFPSNFLYIRFWNRLTSLTSYPEILLQNSWVNGWTLALQSCCMTIINADRKRRCPENISPCNE